MRAGLASTVATVTLATEQTAAQRAQAQAGYQSSLERVQAARVARDKARSDLARLEPLAAEGGLSRAQLEAARAAFATSEAQLQAVEAESRNAQAGIALAASGETQVRIRRQAVATSQAQIAQAEAAVAAARQQLANTRLLSPMAGRIAQVSRLAGENLQPGQPVVSVVASDGLYVNAYVEETKIREVHGGQSVEVDVDAYPGRVFQGKVDDIGAAAGSEFALIPQNNAVGNFTKVVQRLPVRILVEDPEQVLKPGMSATVKIAVRGT